MVWAICYPVAGRKWGSVTRLSTRRSGEGQKGWGKRLQPFLFSSFSSLETMRHCWSSSRITVIHPLYFLCRPQVVSRSFHLSLPHSPPSSPLLCVVQRFLKNRSVGTSAQKGAQSRMRVCFSPGVLERDSYEHHGWGVNVLEGDNFMTAGWGELMALFQSFDCRKNGLTSLPRHPEGAPTHSPRAN